MFYSSLILTKKGPLAKVWLAAHWGDKKLNRPQIFATDITASVDTIVNPPVPLALRMSGHLLLGVVRIYSRKVKYLMQDAHEAMLKINSAFSADAQNVNNKNTGRRRSRGSSGTAGGENIASINMEPNSRKSSEGALHVAGFGEYQEADFGAIGVGGGFQIPFDLNQEYNAEDWIPAQLQDEDEGPEGSSEESESEEEEEGDDDTQGQASQQSRRRRSKSQKQTAAADESPIAAVENFTLEEAWDPTEGKKAAAAGGEEEEEEEEAPIWAPSDDEEEEEDGGGKKPAATTDKDIDESHVSDVEAPRDAHTSMSTADPNMTGQSDMLEADITGAAGAEAATTVPPPQDEEEEEDDFVMPMDDHDEEEEEQDAEAAQQQQQDKSTLSISVDDSGLGEGAAGDGTSVAVGGLDDDSALQEEEEGEEDDEEAKKKARKRKSRAKGKARAKKRRRRNIEIDERTRMSQREYLAWIKDTMPIVRDFVHPSTYAPPLGDEDVDENVIRPFRRPTAASGMLASRLDLETLQTRPTLGDDGQLAPVLLRLFSRHMGHVAGHDFPYKMLQGDETAAATAAAGGEEKEDQDETMEEADATARLDGQDLNESADTAERSSVDGKAPPLEGDEVADEQQQQDEDDFVMPFDDEEEQPLLTQPDETMEDKKQAAASSSDEEEGGSVKSTFSLGLVNDVLGEEEEGDGPRQLAGDELVSSNSKWHAHTIKVYNMLLAAMADPAEAAKAATTTTNPSTLDFDGLSKGCLRRTAAGVFFELLQLKTWDYIEVNQDESFGNIVISPGPKFGEAAPSD